VTQLARHLPVLVPVAYFAAAALVSLLGDRKRGCYTLTLGAVTFHLASTALLLHHVGRHGPLHYCVGGWIPPWGIELVVDRLGAYASLVVAGVAGLVALYAGPDLAGEVRGEKIRWYWLSLLLLLGGMTGVLFTRDLFNLYVFVEVTSITACTVVAARGSGRSLVAAFKYLMLSALGSGSILIGIALFYLVTGHLNMDFAAPQLAAGLSAHPRTVVVALSFFIIGFGLKAALFPLHVWLPGAHSSAPTVSSAILSGLVIKVFAVALYRLVLTVFGRPVLDLIPLQMVLRLLAGSGIVFGSLLAIRQRDLKRMLAYSSVAQIGYVFLGLGLGTGLALTGGLLHVLNHALMKSLLFLCVGSISHRMGTRDINFMDRVGGYMPLTAGAFAVGALSMIGVPLFPGFVSKWYLALGSLEAGRPLFLAVILVSTLLNASYYLPVLIRLFWGKGNGSEAAAAAHEEEAGRRTPPKRNGRWRALYDAALHEMPGHRAAAITLLAGCCLYVGLRPETALQLVRP